MSSFKQPAITKHPKGYASFCIRVCLKDGATWECCTEEPRPLAEVIASIEGEYLGYMRKMLPKDAKAEDALPAAPDPDDEAARF